MANTYTAPNFDIDTDTNVAGLIALKGSAPDASDNIYIFNDATLTIEQDLIVKKIRRGEMSTGAAPAGQRVGHVVQEAGTTVYFGGDATSVTNSGMLQNTIASASEETKNCSLTVSGTASSPCVWTTYGGRDDANKQWMYYPDYDIMNLNHLRIEYAGYGLYGRCYNSAYSNATRHIVNHVSLYQVGAANGNSGLSLLRCLTDINIPVDVLFPEILDPPSTSWPGFVYASTVYLDAEINIVGPKVDRVTYDGPTIIAYIKGDSTNYDLYGSTIRLSPNDIRPTETAPAGFALADKGTSGELTASWTNAADYSSGDRIEVWDDGETTLYAVFDATAGSGTIGGLTDGTAYTLKARATSDNYNYSDFSATATATPTAGTPPDAPSITGVTAGDGQFTATISAASESDTIYLRYRVVGQDWSAEDATYSRTGSGTITVTGLTNHTNYEVTAYAKQGTNVSDWASPVRVTPTDGTTSASADLEVWIRSKVAELATSQLAVEQCYDTFAGPDARWPHAVIDWVNLEPYVSDSSIGGHVAHVQVSIYGRPDDKTTVEAALDAVEVGLTNWQEQHPTNGWMVLTSRPVLRRTEFADARTVRGIVEVEVVAVMV